MASSSASPNSHRICCLKNCLLKDNSGGEIGNEDGRVEVRAFEPKSTKNMEVDWKSRGEAQFHRQCWSALIKATKLTNGSSTFQLSDIERSMILEAKKTAEYHDSEATFKQEAQRIADILKNSNYGIAFTGAGISTAAGIGDFRGKDGKWTDIEKQKNYGAAAKNADRGSSLSQLRPTYTHEALLKLIEMGVLKFLISQNTDGLHRLSGIPADKISELHGNSFIEKCENCDARYERTHGCRSQGQNVPPLKCPKCKINHRTGRICEQPGCGGYLMNTIINFGDYLESKVLRAAEHHASNADSVLVLGSTLKVSPANDLVVMGESNCSNHKLIICNRQTTPYDERCQEVGSDGNCGSRVYGDCDRLMRLVMQEVLPPDELKAWEKGRDTKMVEYGMKRSL